MTPAPDARAVFVGCVRDCARPLPHVLRNIERMSELYSETAAVFIENDSRDGTKEILGAWCRARRNRHLVTMGSLDALCPVRTMRLALARQQYLAIVRSEFSTFRHLVVLDCDEVNARPLDLSSAIHALDFLDRDPLCAGVFANQDGIYYDMWALRHPTRCPGDVWEEVFDCVLSQGLPDEEAYSRTLARRLFSVSPDTPPFEVTSAFGGLGIYKLQSALRNQRTFAGHKIKHIPSKNGQRAVGWQACEHVAFNTGFLEQGERLFVLPFLVNYSTHGLAFGPSAYREKVFDPRLAEAGARLADRLEKARLRGPSGFAPT